MDVTDEIEQMIRNSNEKEIIVPYGWTRLIPKKAHPQASAYYVAPSARVLFSHAEVYRFFNFDEPAGCHCFFEHYLNEPIFLLFNFDMSRRYVYEICEPAAGFRLFWTDYFKKWCDLTPVEKIQEMSQLQMERILSDVITDHLEAYLSIPGKTVTLTDGSYENDPSFKLWRSTTPFDELIFTRHYGVVVKEPTQLQLSHLAMEFELHEKKVQEQQKKRELEVLLAPTECENFSFLAGKLPKRVKSGKKKKAVTKKKKKVSEKSSASKAGVMIQQIKETAGAEVSVNQKKETAAAATKRPVSEIDQTGVSLRKQKRETTEKRREAQTDRRKVFIEEKKAAVARRQAFEVGPGRKRFRSDNWQSVCTRMPRPRSTKRFRASA